jgi:Ca2+-binding RTX toxin-like protein
LVDVENIRLFDSAGKEVTVRVAGSSSYDSVDQAIQYANRGDVIFVAETKEGALAGTTRAAVNMDTTVFVSGGLRVAFEEGANRVVNTTNQLVVNMTGSVKTSALDSSFFGTSSNALEVLGTANVNVNGSALSDLIVGNRGNNVINSLAGNDVVFGGNGSDMLIGGVGNDVLVGGSSHRIAALQHSPDDGVFSGFNLSTNAFRINRAADFEFETGDKVIYKATGGAGVSVADGLLTETTPLYVIRGGTNLDGSVDIKLANSVANAKMGVALDITSNGSATTTHGVTLDNVAYTAANLAGSDYLYGGSGNDQLVATGVTGSLTAAGVRDSLTMNGGSGNDTFSLFGNSGKINLFGGSGADKVEVFDNFLDVVGVNKSARMVDFAAAQDDILSTFNAADLGTLSVEARLSNSGVALSQLVSPPLPIVSGSGENGNYQEMGAGTVRTEMVEMDGYMLSIQDLINLHQAHAA